MNEMVLNSLRNVIRRSRMEENLEVMIILSLIGISLMILMMVLNLGLSKG
jgi:hypothetical protein